MNQQFSDLNDGAARGRRSFASRSAIPACIAMLASVLCWTGRASAGVTGVSVYGQSRYSSTDIIGGVANATGFQNEILGPSWTIFSRGLTRTESQVRWVDFADRSRDATGLDFSLTEGFDRSGDVIAYYAGHGECPAKAPIVTCNRSSDCNSPFSNTSLPGVCTSLPDRSNRCYYAFSHKIALISGERVYYSERDRGGRNVVALGEVANWAGVGGDGSLSVAVFDMSCGFAVGHEPQDADVFAGLMLWLSVSAHAAGDTAMAPERGMQFARHYRNFGNVGVVANDWVDTITKVTTGNGCPNTTGTHSGTGINGCGSHVALAKGATDAEVQSSLRATWWDITQPNRKPTGAQRSGLVRTCNYDCNRYPIKL